MNRRNFLCLIAVGGALAMPGATTFTRAAVPQDDRNAHADKEQEKRDDKAAKEENKRVHDTKHGDDHEWNKDEDRRYRQYLSERHEKYRDYDKLNQGDQEQYWDWRHSHGD